MTSLWQLSNDYQSLLDKDEFLPEDLERIDNLHGLIEDKAISCAFVISELKSKLFLTNEAIKIAEDKRKRLESNIHYLEKYVLESLVKNKIDKIDKHPLFDINVRYNRASVEDYEPYNIPQEYWIRKESIALDKKRIKDDIDNGVIVPGARLIKKATLKIE